MSDRPPTFNTSPQAKPCQCVITAWEYATGIPRATIEAELGHDGCTRSADSAERIRTGRATGADMLGFTGIHDAEILWWAYKRRIQVATVTPLEALRPYVPPARLHGRMHCPTQVELLAALRSTVAIVSVVLDESTKIAHSIAWIDRWALNPSVSAMMQPFDLRAEQILVAHILTGIEAAARLRDLTIPSDATQPAPGGEV